MLTKLCHNTHPSVDWRTFAEYLPHRTAEQVEYLWQGVEDVIRGRLSEEWMVPEGKIPTLKPILLIRDAKRKKWIPFRRKNDEHRLAPRQWAMRFDEGIFAELIKMLLYTSWNKSCGGNDIRQRHSFVRL
mmetsp:Transcript_4638/g.9338  ORF Transcript_4638/g.9338 Transcript_4638/m.9338 type:complete len:130 (-) Transcript_4638:234-623(-)